MGSYFGPFKNYVTRKVTFFEVPCPLSHFVILFSNLSPLSVINKKRLWHETEEIFFYIWLLKHITSINGCGKVQKSQFRTIFALTFNTDKNKLG